MQDKRLMISLLQSGDHGYDVACLYVCLNVLGTHWFACTILSLLTVLLQCADEDRQDRHQS